MLCYVYSIIYVMLCYIFAGGSCRLGGLPWRGLWRKRRKMMRMKRTFQPVNDNVLVHSTSSVYYQVQDNFSSIDTTLHTQHTVTNNVDISSVSTHYYIPTSKSKEMFAWCWQCILFAYVQLLSLSILCRPKYIRTTNTHTHTDKNKVDLG